ncbi:hypothetical protein SRABI118_00714 [Massilia sp. Bi118]|uniref:hypothetical protein n=1 Tax=Massilia sp. Bi118 TaxID=2822346 RepID=UPI001D22269A|nr:hypothetical protein [Massilia sp. Bi118]CAH0159117.1 hypothetical protein SRABI118_00714 [Massilia sp. Bi118]
MNAQMSAWRDYRSIWTAAVTGRDGNTGGWLNWLALLVMVCGLIARLIGLMPAAAFARFEAGAAAGWLVLIWMVQFLPASILMNSASNARLVPRQRRRLMQMAVGGWVLIAAGLTFACGGWRFFPLIATYLLGAALMRAGMRQALVLIITASNWPLISRRVLPVELVQAMTSRPGLAIESVALVLLSAWTLMRLYPAGGDRHLDDHGKVAATIKRVESREMAPRQGMSWGSRLAYGPALRHDCRQRRPAAMLMHALGPAGHWTAWVVGAATILAAALALRLVPLLFGRPVAYGGSDWLLGFGMSMATFMVMFSTAHLGYQLRKTGGEQALLRLTPLAGGTALLNRRLAAGLLKTALLCWGMLVGVILLSAWLIGANGEILARYVGFCCLGGQLAVTGLLGDLGRALPNYGWPRFMMLGLQAACNLGIAFALSLLGGVFAVWLALVGIIGAVLILVLGWRRMMASGPAFPAGRMN